MQWKNIQLRLSDVLNENHRFNGIEKEEDANYFYLKVLLHWDTKIFFKDMCFYAIEYICI